MKNCLGSRGIALTSNEPLGVRAPSTNVSHKQSAMIQTLTVHRY